MKNQLRNCTLCGTSFSYVTKRGRPPATCSMKCKGKIPTTNLRFCSVPSCGTQFKLDDPHAAPPYFCSLECKARSKYTGRQCKYCRGVIPQALEDGRNNFCSYQCIVAASEGISCGECGQPVEIKLNPPWHRVLGYCSQKCREARMTGSRNSGVDPGHPEEAQSYWNNLQEKDYQTNTYLRLATTPSGGPFYKVRPNNLPSDFLKQCSPQTRRGVKFRELQVNRVIEEHSDKKFLSELLLQVGLIQYEESVGRTMIPVPPTSSGYLPSMAEVFPFLSDETRFLLRRHDWHRHARQYYRVSPSRRNAKVENARDKIQRTLRRIASDNYSKRPEEGLSAFTRQCRTLYFQCRELALTFEPVDPRKYVDSEWIPELTYLAPPSMPDNPFGTYGAIQDIVQNEALAWREALPKNHQPLVKDHGSSLWDKLLIRQPLDPTTFAIWFYKMNSENAGLAKPWVFQGVEFNPHDC